MSGKKTIPALALSTLLALSNVSVKADDGKIGASINDFGLKLFQEINKSEEDKNIMISPLSVSMALAMLYNGAGGETREAMARTMELQGISMKEINESYMNLKKMLTSLDTSVVFQIANSIWYRQDYQVEADFLEVNKTFYDAEVRPCNFAAPDVVDTINGWVDTNTNGKITQIIDKDIDPRLVMILINAIYFHGEWTKKFDPENTADDKFTLLDGSTVDCRMMSQENRFPYFENDIFQAVRLQYGSNAFSMTILLPKPDVEVNDLIGRINSDSLKSWTRNLRVRKGEISLPRFKLAYDKELSEILSSLGMGIAFTERANFSGVSIINQLYISYVKHKTFIEVNEEGTEAAAVTAIGVQTTSSGPTESFVMRVDRPFLYLIQYSSSGTIIFLGKTIDPTLK